MSTGPSSLLPVFAAAKQQNQCRTVATHRRGWHRLPVPGGVNSPESYWERQAPAGFAAAVGVMLKRPARYTGEVGSRFSVAELRDLTTTVIRLGAARIAIHGWRSGSSACPLRRSPVIPGALPQASDTPGGIRVTSRTRRGITRPSRARLRFPGSAGTADTSRGRPGQRREPGLGHGTAVPARQESPQLAGGPRRAPPDRRGGEPPVRRRSTRRTRAGSSPSHCVIRIPRNQPHFVLARWAVHASGDQSPGPGEPRSRNRLLQQRIPGTERG